MNQNGLNLYYCVGICTDTCSVMASEQAGAVSKIRKHTKMFYFCCTISIELVLFF